MRNILKKILILVLWFLGILLITYLNSSTDSVNKMEDFFEIGILCSVFIYGLGWLTDIIDKNTGKIFLYLFYLNIVLLIIVYNYNKNIVLQKIHYIESYEKSKIISDWERDYALVNYFREKELKNPYKVNHLFKLITAYKGITNVKYGSLPQLEKIKCNEKAQIKKEYLNEINDKITKEKLISEANEITKKDCK